MDFNCQIFNKNQAKEKDETKHLFTEQFISISLLSALTLSSFTTHAQDKPVAGVC
jgi:hypothetical protein